MGFRMYKSKKAGPVRITASNSGVNWSVGFKGFRFRHSSGRSRKKDSKSGSILGCFGWCIGICLLAALIRAVFQAVMNYWLLLIGLGVSAIGLWILIGRVKFHRENQITNSLQDEISTSSLQDEISTSQSAYEQSKKKFNENLESIPQDEVIVNDTAKKLERKTLASMPEVVYSRVTVRSKPECLSRYVVVDTETNGLHIRGGRIIELSAILFEDFKPVKAWTSLINPGVPIPPEATAVNRITDDMVEPAPQLAQVAESFEAFIGKGPIVGYNLAFDLEFLYTRGINILSEDRKYYDALDLTRRVLKNQLYTFKLSDVAPFCGVVPSESHRSLADCYTTGMVFAHCVNKIIHEKD